MRATVQGGTGAGSKMHVGTVPKTAWVCASGHRNIANAATCLTSQCRERRPQ